MNGSVRTDLLIGINAEAFAANYQCGHCTSETRIVTDPNGVRHALIAHDDGCPVLVGALPTLPDTFRAARAACDPAPQRLAKPGTSA